MKIQNLGQLKSVKPLPHFYLLLGKDLSELKSIFEEIVKLTTHLLKVAKERCLVQILEKETFSFGSFKQNIETRSFLYSHCFFYVPLECCSVDELKELIPIIERPLESTFCIFYTSQMSAQNTFYKTIDTNGCIFQKAEEKSWEKEKKIAEWIGEESVRLGKKMGVSACQLLLKQVGQDRTLLTNEIEKLAAFAADSPIIKESDILTLCARSSKETLWQLTDTIFQKEAGRAIEVGRLLLEEGTAIFSLAAQLRTQFQSSLEILSLYQESGAFAVSEKFPYLKGGLLEKKLQLLSHFGKKQLKEGLLCIHNLELFLRNSTIDPDIALELLITYLIYGTSASSFTQFAF